MPPKSYVALNIRLDPELYDAWAAQAKTQGLSLAAYVRLAVEEKRGRETK